LREQAEKGAGGVEAFDGVIGAQDKAGKMSAVGIAEELGVVIVHGKEERGVGAVDCVLVEHAVYGLQQEFRTIEGDGTLAAQIGLQVGHEESGGDALAGNVANDEAEVLLAGM
jgi:hypothetical protein